MTTRRDFFRSLALGVAGFAILPSATTYARTWKPLASNIFVPAGSAIEFPPGLLSGTIRQLFAEQKAAQTYLLVECVAEQMVRAGMMPASMLRRLN